MKTNIEKTVLNTGRGALKGQNIVMVGLQPWYIDIGCNCKNIAMELAKENKVLYINMPLDRKTIIKQKNDPNINFHLNIIKNKKENLFQIQRNLWNYYPTGIIESIRWIPSTSLFSIFNKKNNIRFAKDIRKAVKKMGFEEFILFNDNDIFRSFYLKELLNPKLYIYHLRDNLTLVNYWRKHGKTIEPRHIAKADLVVTNSTYFVDYAKPYNRNSYYIGQGCDLSLFDVSARHEIADDIKKIASPIVGYVGAISSLRIDERIIETIAKCLPQVRVVLVGPEDEFFKRSCLHKLPNVFFLGKKPLSSLPGYISRFDVCINPQLINEITIGNYPLKIDEYLAMGKPVVATKTKAMKIFENVIYTAASPEEYPELIQKALGEDSPLKIRERISTAKNHTWKQSVAQLEQAIEEVLIKKAAGLKTTK